VQYIAQEWAAIGVRAVPVVTDEFNQLIDDFLIQRNFDAAIVALEVPGDPDPYSLWHSSQVDSPGQNFSGWSNFDADQLMEAARTLVELEDRKRLYFRFQEIFNEDVPAIYTYAVGEHVKNAQVGLLNHPAERFIDFADWYINERRVPSSQVSNSARP